MDDRLSILDTSDGSNSISSEKYKATYHSIHGAIEESMHVFISAGLYYKFLHAHTSVKIFEMGFGTGLNAYLTSICSQKIGLEVEYHSLELHPIPAEIYQQLNFHSQIPDTNQLDFLKLHESRWEVLNEINPTFKLKKIKANLEEIDLEGGYDLIFYDAFAPSSQESLWEEPIHKKLYDALSQNGALVTYCAQGKFKRTLKKLGYKLDKLPGPGRKHEMTRAIKD